jgi:hypothetical protein
MEDFLHLPVVVTDGVLTVPLIADLPIDAVAGAVLYVEETQTLYLYNGASWGTVGGPSNRFWAINTETIVNSSNSVFTTVPDLSVTLQTGLYRISVELIYSTAATTTGITLSFSTSTALGNFVGYVDTGVTTTLPSRINFPNIGHSGTYTGTAVINTDQLVDGAFIFSVTTGGTFLPRFRSEIDTSAVTVKPNSIVRVEKLS